MNEPVASPSEHGTATGGGTETHQGRDFDRAPLVVTWEVTRGCSLACDHCRADAEPRRHPAELATDEGKRLLDEVADFGDPPPALVLSGGDPLERPDLFELVEAAIKRNLPTTVTPAPTPALDRDTVERFVDLGVDRMAVGLDGATRGAHDEFRGEPGTYDAAMRAALAADDCGLPLQVNTTVTADTVPRLPKTAEVVERLGAVVWEVTFPVPIGRAADLEGLSPVRTREVLRWLHERQHDAPFRVTTVGAPFYRRVAMSADGGADPSEAAGSARAGHGVAFVSHTGDVYPSEFLPLSAGNVRERSLVDVYRDADLMRELRDPGGFEDPCGSCAYRATCGGSRSRAFATTGDPLASDPLCPWAADRQGLS